MGARIREAIDHEQWPEVLAFAEAVARERKKRKISQKVISDRTGLPQPYLSQLENGRLNPTLQVQATIARAIGVPLAKLTHKVTVKVDEAGQVIPPRADEPEAEAGDEDDTREATPPSAD